MGRKAGGRVRERGVVGEVRQVGNIARTSAPRYQHSRGLSESEQVGDRGLGWGLASGIGWRGEGG
jgi:hypothetical protein